MSTDTKVPVIMSAVFQDTGEATLLSAMTEDGVALEFHVHPIALALLSLTTQTALTAAKARVDAQQGPVQPPAAPDSPEGLEG